MILFVLLYFCCKFFVPGEKKNKVMIDVFAVEIINILDKTYYYVHTICGQIIINKQIFLVFNVALGKL